MERAEKRLAPPAKLYPVDESSSDPTFAEFRERLLKAVGSHDPKALRDQLAPQVQVNFEGPFTPDEVLAMGAFDREKGGLWRELREVLRLGTVRQGEQFCAPYVYGKFPAQPEWMDRVVITGDGIRVHAEPRSTSPVIEKLSYDVVQDGPEGDSEFSPEKIEGETYPWRQVITPSGQVGYIFGKHVRSPLDFRACFAKFEGKWKLVTMATGD
jgi:hypothetical protein